MRKLKQMNRAMCFWTVLFAIIMMCSMPSIAADISQVGTSRLGKGIVIEGPIQRGDYQVFEKTLRRAGPEVSSVALYSPGGDILGAMKIGRLVRRFLLATSTGYIAGTEDVKVIQCRYALEDSVYTERLTEESFLNCGCASACFFIWAAGIERRGNALGIHRPYFEPTYFADLSAREADEKYRELLQQVDVYLVEMDIPKAYYDRMVTLPSQKLEILNNEEVERSLEGDIPSLGEWLASKCGTFTGKEMEQMASLAYKEHMLGLSLSPEEKMLEDLLNEKLSRYHKCRYDALLREREPIFQSYFD